ncbi:MAG: acyl-[acyl-carrier-protein] thioesterase [Chitinophagales bacterium]
MEQNGIWHEEWAIPSFMIGNNQQMNLTAVCNILQNTAGLHARFRGLGFEEMQQKGHVWILNRIKVEMNHFPAWCDKIQVQSWVSSMRGPFSDRHFTLQNESGEIIGSASTFWVAVNVASRKPARVVSSEIPVLADKLPLCGKSAKLPTITEFEHSTDYQAKYSDLDMVGHVNNVKYMEWMVDHLFGIEGDFRPLKLEMNFVSETLFGEKVVIKSKRLEEGFACVVLKQKDGTVVCRGQIA